jgi:hypothetical protein
MSEFKTFQPLELRNQPGAETRGKEETIVLQPLPFQILANFDDT